MTEWLSAAPFREIRETDLGGVPYEGAVDEWPFLRTYKVGLVVSTDRLEITEAKSLEWLREKLTAELTRDHEAEILWVNWGPRLEMSVDGVDGKVTFRVGVSKKFEGWEGAVRKGS